MGGRSTQDREVWSLPQGRVDGHSTASDGTLFALANGLLGVRGGIEELDDDHGSILPAAFQSRPLHYHERFPGFADATDTRLLGPGLTKIDVYLDGAKVDFSTVKLVEHDRRLEFDEGLVRRHSLWDIGLGRQLKISSIRVVPMTGEPVCISNLLVQPVNFDADIRVEFPIAMNGAGQDQSVDDPRINAQARFVDGATETLSGAHCAYFHARGETGPSLAVMQIIAVASDDVTIRDNLSAAAHVHAGAPLEIYRYVAAEVTATQPSDAFQRTLQSTVDLGFSTLLANHKASLADWWAVANISIDGDRPLERALRFNLLQLFMSASRFDGASIAAKGLTGEGYEGHYFWDTEVFVLPVLALTQPELARTILAYRIERLDKARENARALGHTRGALFPWRTIAGSECSAHYPTGAAQYHVNAAVAFAMEAYVNSTGDWSIIDEGGAELLVETARLWLDLGHFSPRRDDGFLIHGVTGPDEYTALVDNDFYTNAMARKHLRFAAATMANLIDNSSPRVAALKSAIGFSPDEIDAWRQAADQMWLPVDPDLGVHPQDDTFLDKPEFPGLNDPDRQRPLLMAFHPMLLYRHRLCKQGDVVQSHHVAGLESSTSQLARDFDYYEPLTSHDSTLSMTAFGVVAARIGRDDSAIAYHRETAKVDIDDLHGNSSHGAHMAAMAGSWLILAQGWGGLKFDRERPELAPRLPKEWTGYRFRFSWRGSLIEVDVQPGATGYRTLNGSAVTLVDHGREILVGADQTLVDKPAIDAVIFDLDGVLTDTAEAHFQAWKHMADEDGISFDRATNEQLKGIDRRNSLLHILKEAGTSVSDEKFEQMLVRKNSYYQQLIADFSPRDLFPGVRELLVAIQRAGMKIGLASASRNAPELIDRLGIAHFFDHIADPAALERGKPDPEIFLSTARAMEVEPGRCVGVEDAQSGVAAINSAGMTSFGVGSPAVLAAADRVFPATCDITLSAINAAGSAGTANSELH